MKNLNDVTFEDCTRRVVEKVIKFLSPKAAKNEKFLQSEFVEYIILKSTRDYLKSDQFMEMMGSNKSQTEKTAIYVKDIQKYLLEYGRELNQACKKAAKEVRRRKPKGFGN